MRPAPDRRHYVTRGGGIMHSKPDRTPADAREITAEEAAAIKAARPTPEISRPVMAPDQAAVVDLGHVIEELARLHARCDAADAATAEINRLLDSVEIERLEGIEVKS